jgi:hypothetical protein
MRHSQAGQQWNGGASAKVKKGHPQATHSHAHTHTRIHTHTHTRLTASASSHRYSLAQWITRSQRATPVAGQSSNKFPIPVKGADARRRQQWPVIL